MLDFFTSFFSVGLTILVFLLIFGVLIILHEFGHFWAARIAKVEVKEFGFGIPPKIFGIRTQSTLSKGTRYERTEQMEWTVNALPFGGFVRMTGEHEDSKNPYAFGNRPLFLRMLVICGGVIMNFLLGWGILTVVLGIGIAPVPYTEEEYKTFVEEGLIAEKQGNFISFPSEDAYSSPLHPFYNELEPGDRIISPDFSEDFIFLSAGDSVQIERFDSAEKTFITQSFVLPEPTTFHRADLELKNIIPKSPAEQAGLKEGDKIVLIEGKDVNTPTDLHELLSSALATREKNEISITVQREEQRYTIPVQTDNSGKIGIQWGYSFHPEGITFIPHASMSYHIKNLQYPWIQAPVEGLKYSFVLITQSFEALGGMIEQLTSSFSLPSEIGGPVAIAHHTDTLLEHGNIMSLLVFTAMLSLSLAVLNIMPFPGLDGGRFLFLVIEGVLIIRSWGMRNILGIKKTFSTKLPSSVEALINTIGFLLLMGLLVWITSKDIIRLFFV